MAKVITITLSKGGVAKSTITQFLIEKYRSKGYKVLGIDLDPQGNLSSMMQDAGNKVFIYDIMRRSFPIEEITKSDFLGSDRTTTLLTDIEANELKEAISPIIPKYDYIIIDTNAKIDRLTISALSMTDEIIIPTTADSFSLSGVDPVIRAYKAVKVSNPKLKIKGILFVRHNPRLALAQQLKDKTAKDAEAIGIKVFDTNIRESVAIREAQQLRQPLLTYAKGCNAMKDLNAFFKELNE